MREAEDAAVDRNVSAFAVIEPLADVGGPGMALVREQPFLPARAERRLEVVPFPLVRLADVDHAPARGTGGVKQVRQRADALAEQADGLR